MGIKYSSELQLLPISKIIQVFLFFIDDDNITIEQSTIPLVQKYRKYCFSIHKWMLSFVCTLLCCGFTFAQTPQPALKNFTVEDGLPSSEVYDVIQDNQGFIWFATDRGVVKYNGYEFQTFNTEDGLLDNVIFKLYEDNKGRIWTSSMLGQLCYVEKDHIKPYQYNDLLLAELPHYKYSHSLYLDEHDYLYYGSHGNGLIKISDKGELTIIKDQTNGNNISIANYQNNWLTSMTYDYQKQQENYDQRHHLNYIYNKAIVSSSTKSLVRSEALPLSDSIIVFNQPFDVVVYNIKTNKIIQTKHFLNRVTGIDVNGKGEVYVVTQNDGLYTYKIEESGLAEQHHVLNTYTVTACLNDREGGYWITTTQQGIFYIPNLDILSYTTHEGLSNNYLRGLTIHQDSLAISYLNSLQLFTVIPLQLSVHCSTLLCTYGWCSSIFHSGYKR